MSPYMDKVTESADYLCRPMRKWAVNGFITGLLSIPNDKEVLVSGEFVSPAEHLVERGQRLIGRRGETPSEELGLRYSYLQATLNEVLQQQKDAMALRSSMVHSGGIMQCIIVTACILANLALFPSPAATVSFAGFAALYLSVKAAVTKRDKKLFDMMKSEKHPSAFLPWVPAETTSDWPPNVIFIPQFTPPVFNPALVFNEC